MNKPFQTFATTNKLKRNKKVVSQRVKPVGEHNANDNFNYVSVALLFTKINTIPISNFMAETFYSLPICFTNRYFVTAC